ncbi:MAG: conjugal transfer protein TraG N-terminal domain-containing protein [Pseudomonadota bacterium]
MEIFTYGGGEFIVDVLNAVAAMTGSGGLDSIIRLALTIGLIFVIVAAVFSLSLREMMKWYLSILLIHLVLLVPTTNVQVTDRFNPTLAPANVANVPVGLAAFAMATTTAGDWLTRTTETVFGLPANLEYTQTGFIFGSRLYGAAPGFKITNSEFARNINEYVDQCVFYAILLGHLDLEDLKKADDIWTYLTVDNTPSPARTFEYTSGGVGTIVTCQTGAAQLSTLWAAEVDRAADIYGARLMSDLAPAAAKAQLLASLPVAHTFLVGTSKAAGEIIQQSMIINAIQACLNDFSGGAGSTSAIEIYAQTRADTQTAGSLEAISRQAQKWVPLLRIVLETLYYGLFPVLFPAFLLPQLGLMLMRGYFAGFLYLQSWGPIYVILHRIMLGQAEEKTLAASYIPGQDNALTLVTMNSIDAANSDVSMLAGYLMMLVPFIAAGLTRGAMAVGSLSQTILEPSIRAALEASREATTGSISMETTDIGTHRFNQTFANSFQTSGSLDTGRMSEVTADGGMMTITPGGRAVYEGRGAISSMGTSINYSTSVANALQERASSSREQAESFSEQSREAWGHVVHDLADVARQVSEGRSVQDVTGVSLDDRTTESMSSLVSHAERFANQNNVDRSLAVKAFAGVGAQAEWGLPGLSKFILGGDARITGKAGIEGSAVTTGNELYQRAQDYVRNNNLQGVAEQAAAGFLRSSLDESIGENSQFRNVVSNNYNDAKSFERASTDSVSEAERYETASETVARDGYTASQNWDQSLIEYIATQTNENGIPIGIGGAASLVTSPHTKDQQTVLRWTNDFVETRIDEIMQNVAPSSDGLHSPVASEPVSLSETVIRDHFETGRERLGIVAPQPDIEARADDVRTRHQEQSNIVESQQSERSESVQDGQMVEVVAEKRINDDSLESEYEKIAGKKEEESAASRFERRRRARHGKR